MFWIRARFELPQNSRECCAGPNNIVKLSSQNEYALLDYVFYENESHLSGFVDIKLRHVDNEGSSNKVNITVYGTFQNSDVYRGLGTVHLTCP